MSKNIVRKIISAVLFIISAYFIWVIFSETSENFDQNKGFMYFGVLFFSNLFLFLLAFTLQTEKVYLKQQEKKEKKSDIDNYVKKITGETENKINTIISDLNHPAENQNIAELFLKAFAKTFYIVQGLVYVKHNDKFSVSATYAVNSIRKIQDFSEGQGIPGQVAKNRKIRQINDIPEDYIQIVSGLGAGSPRNLIFIPIIDGNETVAVIEAAAFEKFPDDLVHFQSKLNTALAEKLKKTENDK